MLSVELQNGEKSDIEDAIKMRVGGQGAIVTGEGLEGGKQRLPPRVIFLVTR